MRTLWQRLTRFMVQKNNETNSSLGVKRISPTHCSIFISGGRNGMMVRNTPSQTFQKQLTNGYWKTARFLGSLPTSKTNMENEIATLMRQIAEYRVRRKTYRWTRDVESNDMLNAYVFANKKKMLAEQKKVLEALKRSISKSVFVVRRMRKLRIPAFCQFFDIPSCVPRNTQ